MSCDLQGSSPLVSLTDRLPAQIDAQPKQGTCFPSRLEDVRICLLLCYDSPSRLFLSMMINLKLGFDIRDISKPLTTKHCQKQPALLCFSTTRCQPSLIFDRIRMAHTKRSEQSCRSRLHWLPCSLIRRLVSCMPFVQALMDQRTTEVVQCCHAQ